MITIYSCAAAVLHYCIYKEYLVFLTRLFLFLNNEKLIRKKWIHNELASHTSAVPDDSLLVHSERETRTYSQSATAVSSTFNIKLCKKNELVSSMVSANLLDLLSKNQMTKLTVTKKINKVKEMMRTVREPLWNKKQTIIISIGQSFQAINT